MMRRPRTGYPFFPLKTRRERQGVVVFNPVERKEYVVDSEAWGLLSFCDGWHCIGEIVKLISQRTGLAAARIQGVAEPLLDDLTDAGMIWWRDEGLRRQPAPQPQMAYWDITLECNLRCAHCVLAAGERDQGELNTAECESLIGQMAGMGLPMVTLSGGEPLMHRDFFQLAQWIHERGVSAAVSTNGTLIDKHAAGEIARLGIQVQVSLDGSSAEEHERFRRRQGSFEATLAGLENLRSAGVGFTIGSVFNRHNAHDFHRLLDFSISLGAHTFRMIPFIPAGRGAAFPDLAPSPAELKEITQYLKQRRSHSPITITPMELEFTLEPATGCAVDPSMQHGCDGGRSGFTISATGEVLPCSFFTGIRAENVRQYPLAWIWQHSPMLNYFRDLRALDIQGECQECRWFASCLGGCPSANFSCGKMLQPNIRCWIAEEQRSGGPAATLPGTGGSSSC